MMGILDAGQPQVAEQPPEALPEQSEQLPEQPSGNKFVHQRVIAAAVDVVTSQKVMDAILAMIEKAPSPETGLAQGTLHVMTALVEKSKGSIPQNVRTPIAKQVMKIIAALAEAAGLIENADQAVQQASQLIAKGLQQVAQRAGRQPAQGQDQTSGQQPPAAPPMQQPAAPVAPAPEMA